LAGWVAETDWLKTLGGALTGMAGGALGIGIPKSIAQVLLGASRAVKGVSGLADIGIGIAALSQIPREKDDFYRGALLGLGGWELLTGCILLGSSILSGQTIEVRLGRKGRAGTYTVRKGG